MIVTVCPNCEYIFPVEQEEGGHMTSEAAKRFTDAMRNLNCVRLDPIVVKEIETLYDRHQPNISASEALYAFSGHLCNLPTPILLGQGCNSVRVHDLIEKFCELNNLPEPREGWDKKLNPRFYKEVTTMDGNCVMHSQPLSLCPECQENMVKEMEKGKDETISTLRETLLGISVEKCSCRKQGEPLQCPRCRALEVLEQTK